MCGNMIIFRLRVLFHKNDWKHVLERNDMQAAVLFVCRKLILHVNTVLMKYILSNIVGGFRPGIPQFLNPQVYCGLYLVSKLESHFTYNRNICYILQISIEFKHFRSSKNSDIKKIALPPFRMQISCKSGTHMYIYTAVL